MDFNLGPNNSLVAESAKSFANKFIKPNVMEWDESQYFPKHLFKQAGEFGFMGILV
ncbi:MAG: acyl-CoA dehydrogenase family protein, partial [Flavobacteriaceae bacterium]|nr:acyl-CoA dehydrogenase family protein [Flavobacteriaceae bacterium]